MSVLNELQHFTALPWHVRQIQVSSAAVEQIAARAADEIERLQKELAKALAALKRADEMFEDARWEAVLTWRNQHSAAIKAAREVKP